MIKYFYFAIVILTSCQVFENHSHDGKYFTAFNAFGTNFAEIYYEINGGEITINNSLTGTSKLQCKQYNYRIEYAETDGSIRILYVLENGDIKLNDNFILTRINDNNLDIPKSLSVKKSKVIENIGNKPIINDNNKEELGLPFIGEKQFETRPGVSGTGTPVRSIEIKINGDVYFRFKQIDQADKTVTTEEYYAGKFHNVIKCIFKNWDNEIRYYLVTTNTIFEVDKNGEQLSSDECCKNLSENNCDCKSVYYN